MRLQWLCAIGLMAMSVAAVPSYAQDVVGAALVTDATSARRSELVAKIVGKWSAYVEEAYHQHPESWAAQMSSSFDAAPLDALTTAADARTFTEMNSHLLGITAQKLGDIAADLVLVPITPCRVLDTRVTGTPIAANGTSHFDINAIADYSSQGGDASNCSGAGAAGSFAAAIFNFTVVTPSAAGYLTAHPYLGTRPLAATVNYSGGDIKGNLAVVKLDQGASANELSIYSLAQTHVVADMVGYFINPQATELQCQDTAETILTVTAGGSGNALAPVCPTGYTATATNCESSTWQMPFVYFHTGICSAQNNSGSSASLRASQTCCRVPGR